MKSTPTRIQSVSRASRLLLAAAAPGGIGPTQAAALVGCSVPTAHHLLSTLRHEGLLAQDPSRRFVLGPAAAVLAQAWAGEDRVPELLVPPLRTLAAETGETAYLAVWRHRAIRVLAAVEGSQAVRVAGAELGRYQHPHARATGKLLLAHADAQLRDEVLGDAGLPAVTERTVTFRAELLAELEQIRARGWSEDHEEFAPGVSCLAVPVLVEDVLIASLCVSAPTSRFVLTHDALRTAALAAARAAATGGRALTTQEAA